MALQAEVNGCPTFTTLPTKEQTVFGRSVFLDMYLEKKKTAQPSRVTTENRKDISIMTKKTENQPIIIDIQRDFITKNPDINKKKETNILHTRDTHKKS